MVEKSPGEGKLPTIVIGVKDVDGIAFAVSVFADLLDVGADLLQRDKRLLLLLPGNVQRVMGIHGSRPLGGVEEVDFEAAETHVDLFHLAGLDLFFARSGVPLCIIFHLQKRAESNKKKG